MSDPESDDHSNMKKQDGGEKLVRAASSMLRRLSESKLRQSVVGQSHTSFKARLARLPQCDSDTVSVKFKIPDSESRDSKHAEEAIHDFYKQDETIRLFQSMPKGLEYFMAHGQPKQVKDYFDYIKLEQQHARLLAEVEMQKEPFRYRWLQIQEKKYKFLEDMHNFDKFLEDNQRKSTRARQSYVVMVVARRRLTREIMIVKAVVSMHRNALSILEDKLAYMQPVEMFVSAAMRKFDGFRDFRQVMDRHEALKNAYDKSIYRFTNRQESLDKLTSLHCSRATAHKDKMSYMRQEIVDLKKKQFIIWSDNKQFADHVQDAKEKDVHKDKLAGLAGRAIRNMAKLLLDIPMPPGKEMPTKNFVRHFTVNRLIGPVKDNNLSGMIQAIGDIIICYNEILPKLQYDIRHPKKLPSRKESRVARSFQKLPKAKVQKEPLKPTEQMSLSVLTSQKYVKVNLRQS